MQSPATPELAAATRAISALRLPPMPREYDIYALIAAELEKAGLPYQREVTIAPRARVDFLLENGTAIEVKKGKPQPRQWQSQLIRYAQSERVSALLLVAERSCTLPDRLCGKPCRALSLTSLWGLAL